MCPEEVFSVGGARALAGVLLQQSEEDCHSLACLALALLARRDAQRVAEEGALSAIVASVRVHHEASTLQHAACTMALGHEIADGRGGLGFHDMLEAGVLGAVVAAMRFEEVRGRDVFRILKQLPIVLPRKGPLSAGHRGRAGRHVLDHETLSDSLARGSRSAAVVSLGVSPTRCIHSAGRSAAAARQLREVQAAAQRAATSVLLRGSPGSGRACAAVSARKMLGRRSKNGGRNTAAWM